MSTERALAIRRSWAGTCELSTPFALHQHHRSTPTSGEMCFVFRNGAALDSRLTNKKRTVKHDATYHVIRRLVLATYRPVWRQVKLIRYQLNLNMFCPRGTERIFRYSGACPFALGDAFSIIVSWTMKR
jgi:hypothetical protein